MGRGSLGGGGGGWGKLACAGGGGSPEGGGGGLGKWTLVKSQITAFFCFDQWHHMCLPRPTMDSPGTTFLPPPLFKQSATEQDGLSHTWGPTGENMSISSTHTAAGDTWETRDSGRAAECGPESEWGPAC